MSNSDIEAKIEALQERKDAAIEAVREFVKRINEFHDDRDGLPRKTSEKQAFASMFPGESIEEK
jgi:uncharacterized coiled-coil DUF342 family protein